MPVTGLSAVVTVKEIPGGPTVVSAAAMSDEGDGSYTYDFASDDVTKDYSIIVNGQDASLDSQYQFGSNTNVLANTFQDQLIRILGLSQENIRIKNPVYNATGMLLSADYVIYPTALDAENDTNSISVYTITSTYDGTGRLMQTYKSIKS